MVTIEAPKKAPFMAITRAISHNVMKVTLRPRHGMRMTLQKRK